MGADGRGQDLLATAAWHCLATAPDAFAAPHELPPLSEDWLAAVVPGTAASAVVAAGQPAARRDFDDDDWWFRTTFATDRPGPWRLWLDGLATIADVWLNGQHVLHSENMFLGHAIDVPELAADNELTIRFAALNPHLAQRRPRPRWKVARLKFQTQRWFRTTLLGRLNGWVSTPAPVGPWRPVRLEPAPALGITSRRLVAECAATGPGGTLRLECTFRGVGATPPRSATVSVAGHSAALEIAGNDSGVMLSGSVAIDHVERWWPHTHGRPTRYPVHVDIDGQRFDLGQVGFRDLVIDRTDGAFRALVNGVEVFCRGAYWTPLDPVGLGEDREQVRTALEQVREANLNMIRIGGETVYPGDDVLDLLDELGVLLWQDCMFAFYDLPEDEELNADIEAELSQQFARLQPHPCLAVVSGGSEIEQQAAMMGIPAESRAMSQFATVIPALVRRYLGEVCYVASSPTGGDLPIEPGVGVAHYYGVGAYLRDASDARRADVRFAAECLAFATPPERETVERACGGAARAGHHPDWKAAVYRDAGAPWDFEDVTNHYVRELFGYEPAAVRWTDPDYALDLCRAAVAHLFEATWSEWRRAASPCGGGLVFHYRDLAPGAGLGIVDALGRPKAPWYVMRRALAPVAVLVTDEGLNGVHAHVHNDGAEPLDGVLRVELFTPAGQRSEVAERAIAVPAHAHTTLGLNGLFDGFRDLNHAHLFGPPAQDIVVSTVVTAAGDEVSQAVFVVGGVARAREHDLGLDAVLSQSDNGTWRTTVSTRRFAEWVSLDVDGFTASDSWFHLPPGSRRAVTLLPTGSKATPRGRVWALNAAGSTPLRIADAAH